MVSKGLFHYRNVKTLYLESLWRKFTRSDSSVDEKECTLSVVLNDPPPFSLCHHIDLSHSVTVSLVFSVCLVSSQIAGVWVTELLPSFSDSLTRFFHAEVPPFVQLYLHVIHRHCVYPQLDWTNGMFSSSPSTPLVCGLLSEFLESHSQAFTQVLSPSSPFADCLLAIDSTRLGSCSHSLPVHSISLFFSSQ